MTKYENSYHLPSTYVIFWDMLLLYRKYKAKEVVMLLQEFIEFSTCQAPPLSMVPRVPWGYSGGMLGGHLILGKFSVY